MTRLFAVHPLVHNAHPKVFMALVPPSSNREWKPEAGFEGKELLWLRNAA